MYTLSRLNKSLTIDSPFQCTSQCEKLKLWSSLKLVLDSKIKLKDRFLSNTLFTFSDRVEYVRYIRCYSFLLSTITC